QGVTAAQERPHRGVDGGGHRRVGLGGAAALFAALSRGAHVVDGVGEAEHRVGGGLDAFQRVCFGVGVVPRPEGRGTVFARAAVPRHRSLLCWSAGCCGPAAWATHLPGNGGREVRCPGAGTPSWVVTGWWRAGFCSRGTSF